MGLWDDKKVPRPFSDVKPKFALSGTKPPAYAMQGTQRAVAPNPAARPSEDVMAEIVRRNTMQPGEYQSPTRQGHDDIPESTYRDGPRPVAKSPLEILMERLSEPYSGGPDPSSMDFSSLDKALQTRLGALNGARDQMRGNFDKSYHNLQAMHDQFQHQVQTEDAARYNQISDQQKGNLNADTQAGIGSMEQARAKAVAERQAMLQNLGIQAAGGAEDQGVAALNNGIQVLNERNTTNQNLADQQRGTNLAYNNTVAQSIGQQGVARRSALAQQLQGLLGKVDLAEADAKAQNETERQRAISSAGNAGYEQWNDQQGRNMDLFKVLSDQELAREKMGMDTGAEPKPTGLSAVAADLENSGANPQAAQAGLAALSRILAGGNYLDGANGPNGNTPYDRANVIIQKLKGEGVDDMTATQIGISYANL